MKNTNNSPITRRNKGADPNVLMSSLADIATNVVRVFGADPTGVNDSTTAISNALNSNNTIIYFPPGNYKITGGITVNSGTVKKMIGTRNTTFSMQLPTNTVLFNFFNNVEIELITFDFNNGYVTTGLGFQENLGTIRLRNLNFKNVKDMDNTTGTILVYIPTYGNTVDIDTIEFNTLQKKGNGIITDSAGNITGLFVTDKTNSAPTNGTIRNIRVIEMHNIDSIGNIIFEDTSGVYAASAYTGSDGNLVIDNVYGYNFGKRLIKLDNQNTTINKVYGYSSTNDTLAVIGINNTGSAKIKQLISNVQAYGTMNFGISTNQNETTINDVIIDIQKPNLSGNAPNAFGVGISANQVSINNAWIQSERNIVLQGTSATNYVQDLKISNSVLTVPSWGVANVHIPSSNPYGFQNILLQNVTAINNATTVPAAFIDTSILTGTSWGTRGKCLNLVNCTFNGTAVNNYGLNLQYVEDINITNYTCTNGNTVQAFRGALFTTCKNIRIINFDCNTYAQTAIQLTNCDNVRVYGLTSPNSNLSVSVSTSTNVRLKDVDKTKLSLNDSTSQQNTLVESESSYSTTTNRPLVAFIGSQSYDTTLNKPIWCKTTGTQEVDTLTISAGTNASGNITVTLNGVATTVAVTAGMTAGQVGDAIRGAVFKQWTLGGTAGSSAVTFTKTTGGTNSAPTFADTGTTGTTASFAVTTAGANPTWIDATGTAV